MNGSTSPRYAFFLPSLRGGGAERVTVNLVAGLVRRGAMVDMVLVRAEGPYLTELPTEVRVVDLDSSRALASVPRLARYLRRERPQAMVAAMVQANLAALLAKRMAGVRTRLAVVQHSTLSRAAAQSASRNEWMMPFCARQLYPWADRVVAVSNGVAADLVRCTGMQRERVEVIYNPVVSAELFNRARSAVVHPWVGDASTPLIVAIGRLARPKGFTDLIRAFAAVRRQCTARLLILGEGSERAALESLVREFGLQHDVDLPGFVSNPYAYLARAQLFVLSSLWEGLPTVLVEALALGVPVVATDCESGPREILEQGRWGRLVPVGAPTVLAEQILASLHDPLPPAPRAAWSMFDSDVAADRYLKLLEAL